MTLANLRNSQTSVVGDNRRRLRRPALVVCPHFSAIARSGPGRRHLVRRDYDLTSLRTRTFVKCLVVNVRRGAEQHT